MKASHHDKSSSQQTNAYQCSALAQILECLHILQHKAFDLFKIGADLLVWRYDSSRHDSRPWTSAYNPSHESARWQSAVAVAIEAMDGKSAQVAPGAMFFRSAVQAPSSFFRSRTRIATIGHQVFYR